MERFVASFMIDGSSSLQDFCSGLACQLGCITGRVFLPTEPTFVLFEESLPMILGAADRCAEVYGGARAGRMGRANCEGRKTPFRSRLGTSTPGESRKR